MILPWQYIYLKIMYVAIVDLYPLIIPNRPRNKLREIEHFGLYPLYPPSLYLPCMSLLEAYIVEYCGVKWRIILSI
jgi:hypothetical protein